MQRRTFLKQCLAASSLTVLGGQVWAAPAGFADNRLLVIMLRGACDGNNLLVPHGFPFYYQSRSTTAVAAPDPANPAAAIDIGQGYGLSPAVKDSLMPFWNRGQLAFVPFSGSQDLSRSHFEAQDLMETGRSQETGMDESSGYLNRLVATLNAPRLSGMSFTSNLPLSFRGNVRVPNAALTGREPDPPDAHAQSLLDQMYHGTALDSYMRSGLQTRAAVNQGLQQDDRLQKEMLASGRGARPASGFALTARRMAELMQNNPSWRIAFTDIGGWDTHVNQGNGTGQLANNLAQLAQGLAAFADTMGSDWRTTTVVVMSEFGRTFRENGTRGTDHGHGNVMWVMGGSIHGGRLAGEMTDLTSASLFQNRDTPVLNDYRSVLGHLMQRMYGLNDSQLGQVFPGVGHQDYRLV